MKYFNTLGSSFLAPHFYQMWSDYEGETPEAVGARFAERNDNGAVLGTLGRLDVLLALDIDDDSFNALVADLGVDFSGIPYSFRELIERARDGLIKVSVQRALEAG